MVRALPERYCPIDSTSIRRIRTNRGSLLLFVLIRLFDEVLTPDLLSWFQALSPDLPL